MKYLIFKIHTNIIHAILRKECVTKCHIHYTSVLYF